MTNLLGQTTQRVGELDCGPGCCGQPGSSTQPDAVPIACTLSGSDQGDRIAQWHRLLESAPREDIADGLRWRLASAQAGQVAELAAAEQACCGFFDFTLRLAAGGMWLEVRAPVEAADLFTEVFGVPAKPG